MEPEPSFFNIKRRPSCKNISLYFQRYQFMLNYFVLYFIISVVHYSIKNLVRHHNHLESKSFNFTLAHYFPMSPFLSYVLSHSTGQSWDYREVSKAQDPESETSLNFASQMPYLPHRGPIPATRYKNKANIETLDLKAHSKLQLPFDCPFPGFTKKTKDCGTNQKMKDRKERKLRELFFRNKRNLGTLSH